MGASSRRESLSDRSIALKPLAPSQRKCKLTLRNDPVLCYDEKILTLLAWERAAWISSIGKDDKIKIMAGPARRKAGLLLWLRLGATE